MCSIKIEKPDETEFNAENTSLTALVDISDQDDQAHADMQLLSLLREIDEHNYLYTFERCKAFNINARQLRYLEKEHIRRIIPVDQVGILAEFEYSHGEWKQKVSALSTISTIKPADTSMKAGPNNTTTITSQIEAVDTILENTDFESVELNHCNDEREHINRTQVNLEDSEQEFDPHIFVVKNIIRQDLRKVQLQYKKNGFLVERDRRILSSALVEYFRRRSIHMNRNIMESLAVQICEHFPTESKNAWHDTSVPNRRRGRLCLRLYNTQRNKRTTSKKHQKSAPNVSESKISDEDEITYDDPESDDIGEGSQQIQQWLKENKCEDSDELIRMWYNTTSYRTKQLKCYNTEVHGSTGVKITEILQNWPSYAWPIGSALISIDFNHRFAKSSSIFHERWPIFLHRVINLYKIEIKDAACSNLLNEYLKIADTLTDDTKQSIILHLFHAIIQPRRVIHPRQKARRYTVFESQFAVIRLISHPSEMEDYSEPFPYIFLVGTVFDVQRCFIAFKDIRYEMSFMDALYTSFQIFMIFHLNFPLAAMSFWTFVQSYFFNIPPEPGVNISIVETVIKYILAPN